MPEWLKSIWNDAVWSKVIAAGIIALVGSSVVPLKRVWSDSHAPKIGVGGRTPISVLVKRLRRPMTVFVVIFLVFFGLFEWLLPRRSSTPHTVISSSTPGDPRGRTAVLTLKRGPQQLISNDPRVTAQSLTFRNVGDGIAKDAVLSCGTLQSDEQSSHGEVPLIEPHQEVTVRIYIAEIADDILHRNDGVYCFVEPILTYTDEAGRHTVTFDSATGQSSQISTRG